MYVLSQLKVENNTSFGRFYFQLLSDHGICQRTIIFIEKIIQLIFIFLNLGRFTFQLQEQLCNFSYS